MTRPTRARLFTYVDVTLDARVVTCRYRDDDHEFSETATFSEELDLNGSRALDAMCELYFLVAGVSYYKLRAAEAVEAPGLTLTDADVALLRATLDDGLGEFAYRNSLRLDDVVLPTAGTLDTAAGAAPQRGPLIPFGGGIDSIVTVTRTHEPGPSLFVVEPPTGRFPAIERPAARTGLPVLRCTRALDPQLFTPRDDWYEGHVPVTAIVSSLALVAAVAGGFEEVRMSNERSSSSPTLLDAGRVINHQWSKSAQCERLLGAAVARRIDPAPSYRSALRDRSELWIAREFASHPRYHGDFMSCNRAFRQDPLTRATTWCGECEKCLFTDLVLAPFLSRSRLEELFGGREPLGDPRRAANLEVLAGIAATPRPFECVGDAEECAAALVAAAARPDRADQVHLASLAARCAESPSLADLVGEERDHVRAAGAARDLV